MAQWAKTCCEKQEMYGVAILPIMVMEWNKKIKELFLLAWFHW